MATALSQALAKGSTLQFEKPWAPSSMSHTIVRWDSISELYARFAKVSRALMSLSSLSRDDGRRWVGKVDVASFSACFAMKERIWSASLDASL